MATKKQANKTKKSAKKATKTKKPAAKKQAKKALKKPAKKTMKAKAKKKVQRGVGEHGGLTKKQVVAAYKAAGKNASQAARDLGYSTATIHYHLNKD